eukprot:PITA_16139
MGSSSHFLAEDKLRKKFAYHGWKMSLDRTLEEQKVVDYVKGKILEPPSNAPDATKNKYTKGEVKAKKIIRDSIDKRLVVYIFDWNTSKEIYDRMVSMFKVNDAIQVLFLKNKLKDIKKGKDEDIQSYFLRIVEIKNDLLSIEEVIPGRELTITTLGGLPLEWYIFITTILNNDRIPRFEELMSRCIQETRMVEQEMASNRGNPTAFSTHAKRRTNTGSKGHFNGSMAKEKGIVNHGNGQPSKKARNSRYEESNVVNNKQNEYYLISTLSTTSPSDTLGNWLIDSGASRHFTRYKEAFSNLIENEKNLEITLGNWLIDSGASRHFTGYKEAFSNLIENDTNLEIILGDNAMYPVKGVENVTLQLNQGNTTHLQEVLYVPDLKKNLVSISAMEDKGYKVAFIDGKVRLWKKNLKDAFTLGFRVDTLYQVGGSPLGAMSCDTSLQSELWH